MPPHIVFADDSRLICDLAQTWLADSGYRVSTASSHDDLQTTLRAPPIDLIILDVQFGKTNGLKLCHQLREDSETSDIPVILISGERISRNDMVDGLKLGADDYLLKPLDRHLFLAKVESIMRRAQPSDATTQQAPWRLNGYMFDPVARQVLNNGRPVSLTRKEFDLLHQLIENRGRAVTFDHLLEKVWGYDRESYTNKHTIEVHIYRLKRKMGPSFTQRLTPVVGIGYRLD